ncbi:MAG: tetratricopeptide repeat protein [Cyanobacteria bacterium J06649_11]
MSPNFYQKYPNLLKLLSYSIATVMTMGLVVAIPREVAGETQSVSSTEQSAQLAEADGLIERADKLKQEGNYRKAIPLLKKALRIQEKILGKEHPDLSTSLNNLALLYDSQGSYAEAESLYLRLIANDEKS